MSQSSIAISLQHTVKSNTISLPFHKDQTMKFLWEEKWLRMLLMAFLTSLGYYSSYAILKRQKHQLKVYFLVTPSNFLISTSSLNVSQPQEFKPWHPDFWSRFQILHLNLLEESLSLFKALWKIWFKTELDFYITCTNNITLSTSLLSQTMKGNLLDASQSSKYSKSLSAPSILALYMSHYKAMMPFYSLPNYWSTFYLWWNNYYQTLLENTLMYFIWSYFTHKLWAQPKMESPKYSEWELKNKATYFNAFIEMENNNSKTLLPAIYHYFMSLNFYQPYTLFQTLNLIYPYLTLLYSSLYWQNIQGQGLGMTMTGQLHRQVSTASFKRKVGFFSQNSANWPSQHTHFHISTKYGIWGFHLDAI